MISTRHSSLYLGFLITHLADRESAPQSDTLWPALGPCSHLEAACPHRLFLGAPVESQIVAWPPVRSPFHSSCCLLRRKGKGGTHIHFWFVNVSTVSVENVSVLSKSYLPFVCISKYLFFLVKKKNPSATKSKHFFSFKALVCFYEMISYSFAYKW